MSRKPISFETWEVLGVGLPNVFKCQSCKKVWHCFHAPEPPICMECNGQVHDGPRTETKDSNE